MTLRRDTENKELMANYQKQMNFSCINNKKKLIAYFF